MMGMTNPETIHYGMWDGSSIVICAYALTLILITVKRKEYPHVFMLFVPASMIFLAFLYFPGIYSHLPMAYNEDRRQVFRRFRWILFMLPALSFVMTYVFTKMERKQKLMTAMICATLMLVSVFYTSDGQEEYGFWDRDGTHDHLYKVSDIARAMGDTIEDIDGDYLDSDRQNYVELLVNTEGKRPYESLEHDVMQLRMYYSPVRYIYSEIKAEDCVKEGFDISDHIGENIDYVLCADSERLIEKYQSAGCKVLWRLDGACFMKYVNKQR